MEMKETLRGLIGASREHEARLLVPRVGDPPASESSWSTKDVLAHLSAWREVASSELDAVRTGGTGPDVVDEVDEQNAKFYAETRDRTADEVLAEAERSWDELLAVLEACSEEDLQKPRTRRPEQEAWQVIAGNTYFHVAQHLDWWHSERGEDAEAEAAARWAYGLAVDAFPEERRRGIAEYNLGCYYASHGRGAEALPYLRRGIELYPPLVDIARQDTDLDPVRSEPDIAALLA